MQHKLLNGVYIMYYFHQMWARQNSKKKKKKKKCPDARAKSKAKAKAKPGKEETEEEKAKKAAEEQKKKEDKDKTNWLKKEQRKGTQAWVLVVVLCSFSPNMPKPTCPNIRMWQ